MRLNGSRKGWPAQDGLLRGAPIPEWIEARLLDAADFEPDQEPATDFVAAAMRLGPERRVYPKRRPALGSLRLAGAAASLIILTVFAWCSGLARQEPTARPKQLAMKPKAADPAIKQLAPQSQLNRRATADNSASTDDSSSSDNQSNAGSPSAADIHTASYTPQPVRTRHHHPLEAAPRAIWRTETVDRDATGVIAPAWVERHDGEHGDVSYTPVTVDVPLEVRDN